MKYVLDVSVALRVVLPDAQTPKAIRLRDDFKKNIHELIAPSIFLAEIPSALTKAERQKLIPVGDARKHYTNLVAWAPVLYQYGPLTYRAIDISSQTRCGFYDALYAALAERENCELVSADDKMVNALQPTMPFVIRLGSFP